MNKIQFIFGVHNHQPVGNFDFVFEEAYQKAYHPFLRILENHPRIRIMYHTTGPLLDWLSEHHPDFLDHIAALAARDQIEIMTGGYYEPILAVLPDRDKNGQISIMNKFIKDHFHSDPQGLWLAERVWEPHLPKPLQESGVKYVTVDDYHFLAAGKTDKELRGYYLTDEQGCKLGIFPINMKLRYLMPFAPVEKAIDGLRDAANNTDGNLLVMCDDGEKFGLWPGTFEWIYEKNWLDNFFNQLEAAMDEGWLKMTTGSEYFRNYAPLGRVYLPCASYFEMSTWSLPPDSGAKFEKLVHRLEKEGQLEEIKPYLKGGFWRNFIGKYDESNQMYRKSLWVSKYLENIEDLDKPLTRKERNLVEKARIALYRSQCNCAYWHGVFGGLYLPHLRHAVYANLLEAEKLLNEIVFKKTFSLKQVIDQNADGHDEIILRSDRIDLMISPQRGGSLLEFSYLPVSYNFLNTLHRQPEAYHEQVASAGDEVREGASIHDLIRAKEAGLDKYLVYDRHLRGGAMDHFLSADDSPESLMQGIYFELGNFIDEPYLIEQGKGGRGIQLHRSAPVVDNQVELRKKITLLSKTDGIEFSYEIRNQSPVPLTILFAPEFNFSLLAGNAPDRYYQIDNDTEHFPLNSIGTVDVRKRISLVNDYERFAIHFQFSAKTEVWRYPVETISQSEGGFERVYQSSCVLPVFRLSTAPNDSTKIKFKILLESFR
jgi:4-alpha-glucanotransferase